MNTYLVIETRNVLGRVAYIDTVDSSINLLKYDRGDKDMYSISAYTKLKDARAQVDFLNKLYKERGQ